MKGFVRPLLLPIAIGLWLVGFTIVVLGFRKKDRKEQKKK